MIDKLNETLDILKVKYPDDNSKNKLQTVDSYVCSFSLNYGI